MDPNNTPATRKNKETKSLHQPTIYNMDAFALLMIARCYKLHENTQLNKTIISIISDYKDLFITTINDRIKAVNRYNSYTSSCVRFKNFDHNSELPKILKFIKLRSKTIFTIDRAILNRIGNASEFSATENSDKDFDQIDAVNILIRSDQKFHKHISSIYSAILSEDKTYSTCIDILSNLVHYITNHKNPKLFEEFCENMLKPSILELCTRNNKEPKDFILAYDFDNKITAQMKLAQINDAMQKQSKQHTDTLGTKKAVDLVTSFHRINSSSRNIHTSNETHLP